MATIWEQLIECQDRIIGILDKYAEETVEVDIAPYNRPEEGWINRSWANEHVRRAHVDIIDARANKGMWMFNICVFPALDNNSPVYGFDVVAGKKKITGAFMDLSPSTDPDHPLIHHFFDSIEDYKPARERVLPDWAKPLFSKGMMAAASVKDSDEVATITDIALDNLEFYFQEIEKYSGLGKPDEVAAAQNFYCQSQQKNPKPAVVMKSLGLPADDVDTFYSEVLFPNNLNPTPQPGVSP